jgi:hypothetical protein
MNIAHRNHQEPIIVLSLSRSLGHTVWSEYSPRIETSTLDCVHTHTENWFWGVANGRARIRAAGPRPRHAGEHAQAATVPRLMKSEVAPVASMAENRDLETFRIVRINSHSGRS